MYIKVIYLNVLKQIFLTPFTVDTNQRQVIDIYTHYVMEEDNINFPLKSHMQLD